MSASRSSSPALSAVAGGDADADVDGERHRRVVELEGLAHHVEEALGDELRGDVRGAAVEQHDELVAAHPADRVRPAQGARQPGRDRDEQPVAGAVAEGVVDVLEVVEVEEQQRARGVGGGGPGRASARRGPSPARGSAARSTRRAGPGGAAGWCAATSCRRARSRPVPSTNISRPSSTLRAMPPTSSTARCRG